MIKDLSADELREYKRKRRMLRKAKNALEPYAKMYAEIICFVEGMTDRQLDALMRNGQSLSYSNCGWNTYGVFWKLIKPEILVEQERRAYARTKQKSKK